MNNAIIIKNILYFFEPVYRFKKKPKAYKAGNDQYKS